MVWPSREWNAGYSIPLSSPLSSSRWLCEDAVDVEDHQLNSNPWREDILHGALDNPCPQKIVHIERTD